MTDEEKLEKTIAYAKEFTSDPNNQNLLNHEESALRNARRIARSEGKTEGIELGKIETAKKMLKDGLSVEIVNKYTGLSLNEIESLVV